MARFDEHLDEAIEYVGLGKSAATEEIWEYVEFRDGTEGIVELIIDVWFESQGWICC